MKYIAPIFKLGVSIYCTYGACVAQMDGRSIFIPVAAAIAWALLACIDFAEMKP